MTFNPAISPIARRTQARQQQQPTQPIQPTSTVAKLPTELDIFAKSLPERHKLHLEQFQGDRRVARIYELKEYLDRVGELPKV